RSARARRPGRGRTHNGLGASCDLTGVDAGGDATVFSAALAGGPVKGGRVVGASDAKAAFPKADPKTPQDVLATLYRHLGVDPERQYLNNAGRPVSVLPSGKPVEELF